MTISSSLNAGVSGLAANASRLAAISDNIANSATFGYKRVVTDFHSLVISEGTGSYAAGGVRVTNQRLIDERSSLATTSNATDLTARGRGFLPVTSTVALASGKPDVRLLTTGSFRLDANGYLTTSGGLALMGWEADQNGNIPQMPRDSYSGLSPVQVNLSEYTGQRTTEIDVAANLPATASASSPLGDPQTLSVEYFDNLAKSESVTLTLTPTALNTWNLTVRDSASAGAVVAEYNITFDGTPANGGRMANVSTVSGGAYDPATGKMGITVAGGPLSLSIGKLNSPGGLSQIADQFAPGTISKNGFPPGNLTSVETDENGFMSAYFDNGMRRIIAQIPLVDVPNPNGMRVNDDQTYEVSQASGSFLLWDAGSGPTGGIRSYSREESATDVAGELTNLIKTQRAYSSNAKVIQTVDEMMQETTNMKR